MTNKYIGKDINRVDALEKITGAAKYVDDIQFAGALAGKILRSDRPHARIISIDTSEAKKLEGVKAVVTGKDFPYNVGIYMVDQYIFAMEKVRFVGEPVAAVAAETEAIAERALELIKVEYEDLPAVYEVDEALAEGAPLIHENLKHYKVVKAINPKPDTNIPNHFKIRKGNPEEGFKKATKVFENTFRVPQVQHVPLETHGAIAQVDQAGNVTCWTSAQSPFAARDLLAHCFKVPHGRMRIISPYVGGGFGCKAGVNMEPFAIALAYLTNGRPVKIIYTREEEFNCMVVRQGLKARIKSGVDDNGKLTAMEVEFIWNCGAFAGYGVNIVRAAGYTMIGAYECPNIKGDSIGVYTNCPVGSAYRGFGMQETHWALEQQMDIIAHEIGMDPLEFRLKNALAPGKINATGQLLDEHTGKLGECLKVVSEKVGLGKKDKKPYRGVGIAAAVKAPAMPNNAASCAYCKLKEDNTMDLIVSGMEIGQGYMTAMAQIAGEEFGLAPDKIDVKGIPDTDYSPYEWQTVASRLTYSSGNAVKRAAEDAKNQVLTMAAQVYKCDIDCLEIVEGKVKRKDGQGLEIPINRFALGYQFEDGHTIGGPVLGRGSFVPEGIINIDPETGYSPKPVANWTFGAQGVEIDIDPDTGKIIVNKVIACYDVGKVINIGTINGQAYGGIVQGLGTGLYEELVISPETGATLNNSFVDYKIPTSNDIPQEFDLTFLETEQVDGPFGVRGIGEHTMIPTPAAIANAIYDALGVRIKEMPLKAERVFYAMKNPDKFKPLDPITPTAELIR
jgi:carbon-monoxide dehydrogenase large subunit